MADLRFFTRAGPFQLGEIAETIGGELHGGGPADRVISDVKALDHAAEADIAFIDNRKYIDAFRTTKAGAVIAAPELAEMAPDTAAVIVADDPYLAYAGVAVMFYPPEKVTPGCAENAYVAPSAAVPESCRVEAGAVVSDDAVVGENTSIGANAVIGRGVEIGADCQIGANVTLQCCIVGERSIIHPGARIGQDGFGFALSPDGHRKVLQLGRVVIENDVEIGANTTIDRGAGPDTVIGAGTKIDNLVQIAHNVQIGRGCIIVSQVGISGSTRIGDFVMIGGQAGLTGHLDVGDMSRIAAQSGVMKDVEPGATIGGSPAKNMRDWLKETAILSKLAKR